MTPLNSMGKCMHFVRKHDERGVAEYGWLSSRHSFSFGRYYDPDFMGFSVLRVINDDRVAPGQGFDAHGHRDMEIISYVISGTLKHSDSTGNEYLVPAGDIQRMSAGAGIRHAEYNPSDSEPVHFLQIWILPEKSGVAPDYAQLTVPTDSPFTPLVTADGKDGSLTLHQDAAIYRLTLGAKEIFSLSTGERFGYLHIINGSLKIQCEGTTYALQAGDAIGVMSAIELDIKAQERVEALWFDLPAVSHY